MHVLLEVFLKQHVCFNPETFPYTPMNIPLVLAFVFGPISRGYCDESYLVVFFGRSLLEKEDEALRVHQLG